MKKLLVGLVVLLFAAAPAGAQNLIANGGFETPHWDGSGGFTYQDGETMGPWTFTCSTSSGVIIYYDTVDEPFMYDIAFAEGTQICSMGEVTRLNTATQTISGLSVGGSYEIELALISYGGQYLQELIIQMYDPVADAYDLNYTMVPEAVRGVTTEMAYQSVQFTASAATLELRITNPSTAVNFIDDVSITSAGPSGIVTVTLDDPCGLSVGEEGPGSDDYTVVLGREPSADVTIHLEDSSELDQVLIVPGTLVFTAGDWDTAETVTVTAIDDSNIENDPHPTEISHTVVSGDAGYHNMAVDNVNVKIAENDCGAWGYLAGDYNYDCGVDLGDFATISSFGELVKVAEDWLDCSWPNIGGCFNMAMCPRPGALLAFPGAEGEGRWSEGGRGRNVVFVDNLNDSDPGSLRAALASSNRTILFRVSGIIDLNSRLDFRNSYCTIAGQSAPGEGIILKNYGIFFLNANNVIMRHIRSRNGDATDEDAISVSDSQNLIIDHCSASWAADENLSVTGVGTDRVTVQYCVIGEGLMDHSYGSLIGDDDGKVTYHHNFYISNRSRNPRPWDYTESDEIGPKIDFVNNVIYNWGSGGPGYTGGGNEIPTMNYIGNYLKGGPESPSSQVAMWCNGPAANNIFYVAGNYFEGQGGYVANQYSLLSGDYTAMGSPFPMEPVTIDDAVTARDKVLADAGALPWNRNEVDYRLANDYWNGTGALIYSQTEVGGWPTLYSLPYPADDDNDGIPNYWETQYGVSDINGDPDSDGYTNLEEYLNNTNPNGACEPIVYVGATDSRANEAGESAGEFTVFRTGNISGALTVNYTVSGSAAAGADYGQLSGSVTIPGGALETAIPVIPVDDSDTEGPEQVIITIDTDGNYKVGLPSAALVVIIDDGSG